MRDRYQYYPFLSARIEDEAKKRKIDDPLQYCYLVKELCEKYNFEPGQYFYVWYEGKEVHNVPNRWRWPQPRRENPMIPGVCVSFGFGNPFPKGDVRHNDKDGWYLQFQYD